jgi:transcription termination factor NusB
LPQADKAILITAYVEHKTSKLARKIIIDQALVTVKHFSEPNSVKYINAILDKIIE